MADLNTNINIVIQNLKKVKDLGKTFKDAAKDAEQIENKIKAINAGLNRAKQKFNTVDPDMPRDKKGRFVKDADRNRRRNAYAELRMQRARQVTEKRAVERELEVIQRKQRLIKREEAGALKRADIEEKILQKRLKLSAAKGLVERKIREAGSAGLSPTKFAGGEGKRPTAKRAELNAQVEKLKEGFKKLQKAEVEVGSAADRNGKVTARNIQTYRALGSELSRVVEQLNALNRASAKRSIGFEKGRRLQERLDVLDPSKGAQKFAGVKPSAIATARKTAGSVIAAADTGDQNLYNQALSKATAQVSRLEREYKAGLAAEKAKIAAAKKLEAAQRQQARQQQEAERQENRRLQAIQKATQLQERLNRLSSAKVGSSFKASKAGQIADARSSISAVDFLGKSSQEMYNRTLIKATAQVSRLENEYKATEQSLKEERRLRKIGAKARRRAASKRADIQGRFRESLMLGAGFPLLFGGGVGAVAGGVGGAIAQRGGKGFGAQIFFSAIGQQFDKLISSMVSSTARLGQALGSFTQDTSQIVTSLGLAGTAEGERIKMIETLQGKQAAFNAAMQQLVNAVGEKGASDLKLFGDNLRLVSSEFRIFFTKIQAGLASLINAADRFFKISGGAQAAQIKRFGETSTDPALVKLRAERERLQNTSGGGRAGAKNRQTRIGEINNEIQQLATTGLGERNAETLVQRALMGEQELLNKKKEQFELDKRIVELKKGGMNEALATEIAGLEQVFSKGTANLEQEKKAVQEKIRQNGWTDLLGLELKGINTALDERVKLLGMSTEELKKYLATQKQVKEESDIIKVKWEDVKETIASGLTSAVQGLIDGTKSLGESLAGIAKSIGSMYLKAAITNMLPGLAEGGYVSNGIKPFSSGGMVTRPTMGLVGEAGEDEYIIPASKMAQSMQRYSAGARGESVIPGTGQASSGGGAHAQTTVNYSGPILNFNSEEFVPKSAIGEIINSAASRGARAGEARTLSTLQNSRSRRSNIGL